MGPGLDWDKGKDRHIYNISSFGNKMSIEVHLVIRRQLKLKLSICGTISSVSRWQVSSL